MRYAVIRAGTAVTTALITAAVADALTEHAENLGWLGGSVRDAAHESVLPTLLVGLALGVALAIFVAFGAALHGPLLHRMNLRHARITDFAFALGGSAVCAIAMEGYETRFGGVSPFDPHSVICSHAPALLAAFIAVAPLVRAVIGAALRLAGHAGVRASGVVVRFLRKTSRAAQLPASRLSNFSLRVVRRQAIVAIAACGLRAPPASTLSGFFIT